VSALPRNLRPIRLSRRPEPFDSDDYLFELKIDGFRSLAYLENGQCDLVSRNGNTFRNFKDLAQWIGENLRVENAVIDGEIACVDDSGRSIFNDLLFRRRECLFFAFDLLRLNGEDLRGLPLVERKARLKALLRRKRSRVLYVDHIEKHGQRFFEKVCVLDLEGIVAKRKDSLYRATETPSPYWIKIKNLSYTQAGGREELFDPAHKIIRASEVGV
jgi:bifunctional non-homologous end joining protein LigD